VGFSSHDDLVNQITTNGKFLRNDLNKAIVTAQVAGGWHDLGALGGYPFADTAAPTNNYAGTSLTYVATTDTSTLPSPIWHGGNVSTATKHILNVMAMCGPAAAGAPWILMLVDQLGYVRIQGASSVNVTEGISRTVTMTALGAGARYPYGEGSRLYFSSLVAPGAGGPNISALTYTNSNSTPATGKSIPYTVSTAATPPVTSIIHSGNAANRFQPFLPLAAGDTGVADIEAFTLSGGVAYTGTSSVLVLHHVVPLLTIPVLASGVAAERDLVNQLPSMPRVRDGAHLKWLMYSTGATSANSPLVTSLDFGWGG
jgi:hypothetical protein